MQAKIGHSVRTMTLTVDAVFDKLLSALNCHDGSDAYLISHWQGDGFRIQVSRKNDGATLTKFVSLTGAVSA